MGPGARMLLVLGLLGVAAFCGFGVLASAELGAGAWSWRLIYGTVGALALAAIVSLVRGR